MELEFIPVFTSKAVHLVTTHYHSDNQIPRSVRVLGVAGRHRVERKLWKGRPSKELIRVLMHNQPTAGMGENKKKGEHMQARLSARDSRGLKSPDPNAQVTQKSKCFDSSASPVRKTRPPPPTHTHSYTRWDLQRHYIQREGVELQGLASGPYINLRRPLLLLITVLASSESVIPGFLGLKN